MRRLVLLLSLALAGCFQPRTPVDHRLRKMIQSVDAAEREREFQTLAGAPAEILPNLKMRLAEGYTLGFPCVALLYNLGEGDAVPLELRVLHVAKFSWPARFAEENRVLEPYVWNELFTDLRKAGKPVLRLLAEALAREAPDEARAMRVCDAMLRIGGATPHVLFEEFARLLDTDRDLGGLRVRDVAGAALLHLAYQDVTLYRSSDLAAAARARIDALRGAPEETWMRMGVDAALDASSDPREAGTWSDYVRLLTGGQEKDPVARWGGVDGSADLLELAAHGSWNANRLLERREGVVLRHATVLRRLWDLRVARWHPRADPGLGLKWRRWLHSRLLRLSIFKIGADPEGRRGVAFVHEKYFHSTEDETATLEGRTGAGLYQLHAQSLELGTRLVASEVVVDDGRVSGELRRFDIDAESPVLLFHPLLATGTVLLVEEVDRRGPATAPDAAASKIAALCRKRMDGGSARALAYLGETRACDELASRGVVAAGETRLAIAAALVMLGDPRGLDLGVTVTLTRQERAMASSAAKEERLKAWLKD